jgi:TolB protein
MKMIRLLALFALLGSIPLAAAQEDSQEIVVSLETEIQLLPVHMGKILSENSAFGADYLEKLEKIIAFDLHHNGMTQVLPPSSQRDALITSFDQLGTPSSWRAQQVYYVVQPKVKERSLSLRTLAVNNNVIKAFDNIALTGDLSKDRTTLHHLSDTLHKGLFGTEGIASTRILYTVRTKQPGVNQWSSEVWEADYDGGNARQITKGAGYCVTPAYAPPKEGLVSGSFFYVSYLNGQPKIFHAPLKGSGSTPHADARQSTHASDRSAKRSLSLHKRCHRQPRSLLTYSRSRHRQVRYAAPNFFCTRRRTREPHVQPRRGTACLCH